MNKKNLFRIKRFFLTIADLIIIILAYTSAVLLYVNYDLLGLMSKVGQLSFIIVIVVLFHLIMLLVFRINRSLWQFVSVEEALRIVLAIVSTNMLVYLFFVFDQNCLLKLNIVIAATLFIIVGMLGIRIIYRYLRLRRRLHIKTQKAVIIGAGEGGMILLREICANPTYDTRVIGFVDDAKYKKGSNINGYVVLGTTDELAVLQRKHQFTIAYIAIPSASKDNLKRILNCCQAINLNTKIMTISEVNDRHSKIRDVSIDDLLGRGELHLDCSQINDFLTGKCVLVTGAGGSIGSELCRQIVNYHPKTLVLLDIYENNLYDLQMDFNMQNEQEGSYRDIEFVYLIESVASEKAMIRVFSEYHPDIVFHAAAHKHVPLMESVPREAFFNNVYGTYNVIKSCITFKAATFILISTDKAVNPTNVMGATKRMVELMVQAFKNNGVTTLAAVRFGNVLNSNGSVIPLFKKQIMTTGTVTVTDPEIQRYFMTIPEAAQLVLQAGAYAENGEIFVLDMGKPVKILDLAENLIRLSGFRPYDDIKIKFVGLRPGEKMFEELVYDTRICRKTKNDLICIAPPEDVDQTVFRNNLETLTKEMDQDIDIKSELLDFIYQDFSVPEK